MRNYHKSFSPLCLGISSLVAVTGITAIAGISIASDNRNLGVQIAAAGTPLAQELQGKPVVVEISADWCSGCKAIVPTISALKKQYQNKATFVVFNVTDKATTQASEAQAKKLGLASFFAAHKSQTSTVAILDPSNGQVLKLFQKNTNQKDYQTVIDSAIARLQKK